jgi:hypothetical protein
MTSSLLWKKSSKIPKGQSESVHQRRTDNTIAKKKVQKDKRPSTKHTYKTKDREERFQELNPRSCKVLLKEQDRWCLVNQLCQVIIEKDWGSSLLLHDKPQLFSIITWQTPALLYYYLTNPSPSLLLPDKPKPFSIITWQTPAGNNGEGLGFAR